MESKITLTRNVPDRTLEAHVVLFDRELERYVHRLDNLDYSLLTGLNMETDTAADILLVLEMLFRRFSEFQKQDQEAANGKAS